MSSSNQQGKRWLLGLGLFVALTASISLALEHWPTERWLPLTAVRFDGELGRLQEADLREALQGRLQGGFLGVEVRAIRSGVESLPWVDTATVQRVWPDALQITVAEQQPVARWGGAALMNARAEVFQPRSLPELSLPDLAGPPGSAARVLAQYEQIRRVLAPLPITPVGLTLDERRAWTLTLAEGGRIRLGRTSPEARLRRFVAAWPHISMAQERSLAMADLRYPNGFALRWQDED